jgi:hypothetical protein
VKTEAETIIGIYLGFQSEIGCGETVLFFDNGAWRITWRSPRGIGDQWVARYAFSPRQVANLDFEPEAWGRILATEVRNQWGGNPTKPGPDAKPIQFIDGLEMDGGGE